MVKLVVLALLQFSVQTHILDLHHIIKNSIPPKSRNVPSQSVTGLTIRAYQNFISSQDKPSCIFSISCSNFSNLALQKHGFIKGLLLTTDRLTRCNGPSMALYPIDSKNQRSIDTFWLYLRERDDELKSTSISNGNDQHTMPTNGTNCINKNIEFAHFLENFNEFERAVQILQASDSNYLPDSVEYDIGRLYYKAGNPEKAIEKWQKTNFQNQAVKEKAALSISYLYFRNGNYPHSISSLEGVDENCSYKTALLAANYLLLPDTKCEQKLCSYQPFAYLLPLHQNIKKKNPYIAGLASAVIPGAGKLYLGRKMDALQALYLVALTGYLAYEGYQRENKWQFAAFSFASVSFYAGTVYGSFLGVKAFNQQQIDEFKIQVQCEVDKIFFDF